MAHGGAAWAGAEAAPPCANDQHRRADEVLCHDRIAPWEIVGIHPYALKFPMMRSDEQLADLADDIARNGQREPIDITPAG